MSIENQPHHRDGQAQGRRLSQVNTAFLKSLCPRQTTVKIARVEEAEGDEMWSFVGSKSRQHWLWHAIDHTSGKILAYVFGLAGAFEQKLTVSTKSGYTIFL